MSGAPGASVVICSHNGAPRLPATLGHLAAQAAPAGLRWEVLVIDNASTAASARGAWPSAAPAWFGRYRTSGQWAGKATGPVTTPATFAGRGAA